MNYTCWMVYCREEATVPMYYVKANSKQEAINKAIEITEQTKYNEAIIVME